MKKLLEFFEEISKEKSNVFDAIEESGITKIENQTDVFLYISDDKKNISTKWGEFDPRMQFSYLVYLFYYHAVTEYVNGGLEFIGFYDSDYRKIDEIPLEMISIIGCNVGCNFENKKNPTFSFKLKQRYGNSHTSFRANAHYNKTCQGALDSVWSIDKFYKDWWDSYSRTPNSLM